MRPMKQLLLALVCTTLLAPAAQASSPSPYAAQARQVTITRDDWGIAHIQGKTDADAVFGMMYAQAEDDFNRIETNFLQALGRLAEAEGESALYRDLRQRLFIDPARLKREYASSPAWLRALMDAWAGGLNHYLGTHPEVKPRVIKAFEPWMALAFSEGSIGGDIERISIKQLEAFYGKTGPQTLALAEPLPVTVEPTGSNGFAVAPARTASGHALLWINPHTSFFFRSEQQVQSEQGLNAYGAATWGQFFIYQGFNSRVGWMHTSSSVDNIDEFLETVEKKAGRWHYRHGKASKPFQVNEIELSYKTTSGAIAKRRFTTYRSHHGPVVRSDGQRWVSVALMEAPQKALTQSFLRTKASNLKEFRATLDLHTNSSNNTVYADADGNIAYFHANFIPRRDTRFDWTQPVDGSDPATDWGAPLSIDESPNAINPRSGWVQNVNDWPYAAAGPEHSPRKQDYPAYVDAGSEQPRGVHAVRLLSERQGLTPESLAALAFDPDQPAFEWMLPRLFKAFDETPSAKAALAEPIELLRRWDHRWSNESVANTIGNLWADDLWSRTSDPARKLRIGIYPYIEKHATNEELLASLQAVVAKLQADFGNWRQPWGEINRFQRTSSAIVQPFSDDKPSIAVPFTSARWGSLASFGAQRHAGSKRFYGNSGNSFLAAVEFGPRLRAIAVTAGGQSGHADSPHFTDQAQRYVDGRLREVLFHADQLEGHVKRRYHPGD